MPPRADRLTGRLSASRPSARFAVFTILGASMALGHAPFDLWWVTIAALAAALVLLPARDWRSTAFQGWALGIGYFAVSLRWIISPFLVHIERDGWMAPFALILMAAGFALFWGAAAGLSRRFWGRSPFGIALAITTAEVVRSLILTGFPWALLGHVLVPTPFAQLAAFGGSHLLTLCVALLAATIATLKLWPSAAFLGLAALIWPALAPGPMPNPDDAAVVRLVQPNAPQEEKWDPVMSGVFFDRMLGFTGDAARPDLIVWPESAIAMLLNDADAALAEISDAARGTPVIVGVNRYEAGFYYNSFVHVGRGGQVSGYYDKQHLVPFGEYTPGGDLLHQIGIRGYGSSYGGGFTKGSGTKSLLIPGIGPIRPLICYEGIFAEEIGGADERPRAMILITNDAWFGKAAGPRQHLAQAQLRAIEQGLPMVRVANTGISAMIDAKGRITATIPLNTAGYVDAVLPPSAPPTLYSRAGEWPLVALLFLLGTGLTIRYREIHVDRARTEA